MRCVQLASTGQVPWCLRLDKALISQAEGVPLRAENCPIAAFTDENCNQNPVPAADLGTRTEIYKPKAPEIEINKASLL